MIFRELREIRGLSDAYATMSSLERELGNHRAYVLRALSSYVLRQHIGKPEAERNLMNLRSARARFGKVEFSHMVGDATSELRELLVELRAQNVNLALPVDLLSAPAGS